MPYEANVNIDRYLDCIGALQSIIYELPSGHICIVGDFNTDFKRNSIFTDSLISFINDNSLICTDSLLLPSETHTFVSSVWNTTSWIDHCIATTEVSSLIGSICILYDFISSDHKPMSFNVTCTINSSSETSDACNTTRISQRTFSPECWLKYNTLTDEALKEVRIPVDTFLCRDMNCLNSKHIENIECVYDQLVNALQSSNTLVNDDLMSGKHYSSRRHHVPGWNATVKEAHQAAREAYLLWNWHGKPRSGNIATLMRNSRAVFKYTLRACRRLVNQKRADAMATKLLKGGLSCHFWKDVKKLTNCRPTLPKTVDGVSGENNIAELWRKHYHNIFNSVFPKNFDPTVLKNLKYHTSCAVSKSEVSECIKKLSTGKAPDMDNLTAEHLKNCNSRVHLIISMCFSAMLVHGYLPSKMISGHIVPVIKNKCGKLSSKSNFRPIGICTIMSKLFEYILLSRLELYLKTSDNQFGFKNQSSTNMCIFLLKEILHFYKNNDTSTFVTFLDASKAFDKVNHGILFHCLLERHVPVYLIRILHYWYTNQKLSIRWGSTVSESFTMRNGVRQGGILSPLLFNVYVDRLSTKLNQLETGCLFNGCVINHLMYADDIVLFAPSVKGLQSLINVCYRFGIENDIVFNDSKTVFMKMLCNDDKRQKISFPPVLLGKKEITLVNTYKYLGHFISDNLNDNVDIKSQTRLIYARGNMLSQNFNNCSNEVKQVLFRSYMYNIYCCSLWSVFSQDVYKKLISSYNNCFRILFKYPKFCSASQMFVENRVRSFKEVMRISCGSLLNQILLTTNRFLNKYYFCYLSRQSKPLTLWKEYLYIV